MDKNPDSNNNQKFALYFFRIQIYEENPPRIKIRRKIINKTIENDILINQDKQKFGQQSTMKPSFTVYNLTIQSSNQAHR